MNVLNTHCVLYFKLSNTKSAYLLAAHAGFARILSEIEVSQCFLSVQFVCICRCCDSLRLRRGGR